MTGANTLGTILQIKTYKTKDGLKEILDKKHIPSDYGGGEKSIDDLVGKSCSVRGGLTLTLDFLKNIFSTPRLRKWRFFLTSKKMFSDYLW